MSTRPTDHVASLLPPQATTLERDLEQATARVADVPVQLASWNADTCPPEQLAWLGWALSVDDWDPAWPDSIKRAVVRDAAKLSQRRGTVWAVQHALDHLGTNTRIEEWWAMQPPGAPGTFRVTSLVTAASTDTQDAVITPALAEKMRVVIDKSKPLSRAYTLRVGAVLQTVETEAAVMRPMQKAALSAAEQVTHKVDIFEAMALVFRPFCRVNFEMVPAQ